MMIFISVFAGILLVILAGYWFSSRGDVVDFRDVAARQRAAAAWVSEGDTDEAEQMLRMAVNNLQGWEQVLARADLANLLTVCGRDKEVIDQLTLACEYEVEESNREVALELRIRLAHFLSQAERPDEALAWIADLPNDWEDRVLLSLATEAHGEILIESKRYHDAIEVLQTAHSVFAELGHDRAASSWVTLAYATECEYVARFGKADGVELPWSEFDSLPADLQRAIFFNLSDRQGSFANSSGASLLRTVVEGLITRDSWNEEKEELQAIWDTMA